MRHRRWITFLNIIVILGLALSSQAEERHSRKPGQDKKISQEQVRSCIQNRAWIAYFRSEEGELAAVRDTLNTDQDEDWIGLRFTDYGGARIRLGVLPVINRSAEFEERGTVQKIEVPVAGIQEMLTLALYETRRFDIIEQKRAKEIVDQQTRQDIVEPSPSMIANMGKVLGVQYLVYSTVNEWTPERARRHRWGSAKKEAEVAMTFTLTEVGTGRILFMTAERARIGEWSSQNVEGERTYLNTPVAYAVRACANKAAFNIATFLRDRKWKGSVVDIKSNGIYINAGSQQGMAPQARLSVLAVRGIVKDKESGTTLGEDLRGIGTLEVIVVQTGFSIAQVVEGCKGLKVGDRVELATEPILPPKIPECEALDTSQVL